MNLPDRPTKSIHDIYIYIEVIDPIFPCDVESCSLHIISFSNRKINYMHVHLHRYLEVNSNQMNFYINVERIR